MKFIRPAQLDKIRLIFFSSGETDFRQFEFNLQRFFVWIGVLVMMCLALFVASVAVSDAFLDDGERSSWNYELSGNH